MSKAIHTKLLPSVIPRNQWGESSFRLKGFHISMMQLDALVSSVVFLCYKNICAIPRREQLQIFLVLICVVRNLTSPFWVDSKKLKAGHF